MRIYIYTIVILLITLSGVSYGQSKFVPFSNPNIYYEGRILYKSDAAQFSWPGTSVSILFEGSGISTILKDSDTANYYNVVIDDKNIFKIHTDTIKRNYILASGLTKGKHKVQLFKRTESDKGNTLFYGFEIPDNGFILPLSVSKKRRMEFFGNSITCGYAMEDKSGRDSRFGYFENNYLSYAAITARHFDAQYYCTSKSGIGIMVSWFPIIMPEMYDRLDPSDSTSEWDFTKYTPDIVVINLFQNDSWIVNMPRNDQFIYRFGKTAPGADITIMSYKNFVNKIRIKYPNAYIICSLGNMDATKEGSPWPGYIQQSVRELNDKKLYTYFFKYKNTDGHPKVDEQQSMADSLIEFIENNIKW